MAKIIKYDPTISIEEMRNLGERLTIQDIKKHIHCNGIDKDYDNALYKYRLIQQYRKEHPDDNKYTVSQELTKLYGKGFSRNSVDRYWEKKDAPKPFKYLGLSILDAATTKFALSSVAEEDRAILKIILQQYVQQFNVDNPQFECDLTFSKGDFYRKGVPYPRHCYDLYPEQPLDLPDAPNVYSLKNIDIPESAINALQDDTVSSIVIDLPQKISENGLSSPEAFADIKDLAFSYYEMLSLAYNKLRPQTDTQSGGILVVKVGDISYNRKILWLSNIVSELATGKRTRLSDPIYDELKKEAENQGKSVEEVFPLFDFTLVDKFVHRYKSDELDDSSEDGKHSIKAHDFFLVFSKGRKEEEYDIYYTVGNEENVDNILSFTDAKSEYGTVVYSRLSLAIENGLKDKSKYKFEIAIPKKNDINHIDFNKPVSNMIVQKLKVKLDITIPFGYTVNGKRFIDFINETIREQEIKKSNQHKFVKDIIPQTVKVLKDIGIVFLEEKCSKRNHFNDNTRTIINTENLEITKI